MLDIGKIETWNRDFFLHQFWHLFGILVVIAHCAAKARNLFDTVTAAKCFDIFEYCACPVTWG